MNGNANAFGLLAEFDNCPSDLTDGPLFVSARMLSDRTGTMLDDRTADEVATALGRPVVPALTLADVGRELRARQRRRAA